MIIGTVIGSVVSTRKHDALVGNKLLIVKPLQTEGEGQSKIVAVDVVGAGVGEIVLVATGSSARYACDNKNAPVDAAIVGLVDEGNNLALLER
ncbi:MAG: EutN/CcmL family microcompartment protein [Cellulosilyticaceae bacterium]